MAKLSGSLFFSDDFDPVASVLRHVLKLRKSLSLVVVAGGGAGARGYIGAARELGSDQSTQDELGIEVSRLNASVLTASLSGLACRYIPTTVSEIVEAVETGEQRLVISGGLHPGQSTNAVGALIAEKLSASRFLNFTDVDGVYTADPNESKDAVKLDAVSVTELSEILGRESMRAGSYDLMDLVALKLIERSRIPTTILRCDPKTIEHALLVGDRACGTRIITDSDQESV